MKITKHQAEMAIIVLGVAVIAVIAPINISRARKQLKVGGVKQEEKVSDDTAPASGSSSVPASAVRTKPDQEASLKRPIGRDPFAMPRGAANVPVVDTPLFVLKGISVRKGAEPVALIGSAIVRKGGMVGDARVVKIGSDHVLLIRDGKEYKLTLERGR